MTGLILNNKLSPWECPKCNTFVFQGAYVNRTFYCNECAFTVEEVEESSECIEEIVDTTEINS